MKTLNELMIESDKADWGHNYCVHYEKWFESLRNEPITLLEVGIGGEDTQLGGASLKGWVNYFQEGIIGGVDLYDKKELERYSDRLFTYRGSQDDPIFLKRVIEDLGTPDIIIDDASHLSLLSIRTFEILFPLLKSGGIYCCEDLSCSFRLGFNGVPDIHDYSKWTAVNYFSWIIKDMCNPQYGISGYQKVDEWKDIESIHFYPELVIIKKK